LKLGSVARREHRAEYRSGFDPVHVVARRKADYKG
jgi:hypothetical protein